MKTTTMIKAWEIAHTMIDNLHYDTDHTESGCGKTWSKPKTNATVIDLGNRLEVNKENGETINIWIEPISDEDTVASMSQPTILEKVQRMIFTIANYEYINDEASKRLDLFRNLKVAQFKIAYTSQQGKS